MCLAVRRLVLVGTSVDNIAITADALASFSAGVEELAISSSPDIVDILTSPQCSPHVVKIRKLWVDNRVGMKLLSAVAVNLQHLHLDSSEPFSASKQSYYTNERCCKVQSGENLREFLPLPTQLPRLRSIEISLSFGGRNNPSFVPILASVARAASANLQEICVIYTSVHGGQNRSFAPQIMAAVEAVIASCTGSPRIRWRTGRLTSESTNDAISASLTEGMPRLHTEGRLLVEKYSSYDDSPFSWVAWFAR
ncbi:hypothetical protein C8R45DRAFT_1091307 [Mycena sanguinolenta]|nr:hypothetical protein C8R45DRAFT_1091307 [Mycena sanguinolenta]